MFPGDDLLREVIAVLIGIMADSGEVLVDAEMRLSKLRTEDLERERGIRLQWKNESTDLNAEIEKCAAALV